MRSSTSKADSPQDRGASLPLDPRHPHPHILAAFAILGCAPTGTGEVLPGRRRTLGLPEGRGASRSEVDGYLDGFIRRFEAQEDLKQMVQILARDREEEEVVTRNVADVLWHMVEEELQHGELDALLWQDRASAARDQLVQWKKESGKRKRGK